MSVSKNEENVSEVIIGSQLPDGRCPILRQGPGVPDGYYELGTISPLKEGQPIHGDVVQIEQKGDRCFMTPVESGGPPKVNNFAYRSNWSNIFGNQVVGQA